MPPTSVTLPRSCKKYLGYYSRDAPTTRSFFSPHPGIQVEESREGIRVSLCQEENRLPIHCQSDQCKATLLNALQSLQLISTTFLAYKDRNKIAKAIAESLSDYLRFDEEKYFWKIYFLNTMAWVLLLLLVSIVVLPSLAIPFTSALYLMLLVPVIAAWLGLMTGSISNYVSASRELEVVYEKLIAAIESVNNKIVKEQKLAVITEESSVSSLEVPNNTDHQSKYGLLYKASQLKPLDSHTTETETNVSLSAAP